MASFQSLPFIHGGQKVLDTGARRSFAHLLMCAIVRVNVPAAVGRGLPSQAKAIGQEPRQGLAATVVLVAQVRTRVL